MREKKSPEGMVRIEFSILSSRVLSGGQFEICVVAGSEEDGYFTGAMAGRIPIPLELKGDLDATSQPVTVCFLARDTRDNGTKACFIAKAVN